MHNSSFARCDWAQILIPGLGSEKLVIKSCVWFCSRSLVSHRRVFITAGSVYVWRRPL